jgi:hypothetical protein
LAVPSRWIICAGATCLHEHRRWSPTTSKAYRSPWRSSQSIIRGVAERAREPLVGSLHGEPAVELLGLELDVVERERVGQSREEVLLADLERRAVRVDPREQAVEARIRPGSMALRVRGLLVVPVVERPDLESAPGPPEHVLGTASIATLEEGERLPEAVERVVDREVQTIAERQRTELSLAFELALVLVVGERGHQQAEHEEEQQRGDPIHDRSIDLRSLQDQGQVAKIRWPRSG